MEEKGYYSTLKENFTNKSHKRNYYSLIGNACHYKHFIVTYYGTLDLHSLIVSGLKESDEEILIQSLNITQALINNQE